MSGSKIGIPHTTMIKYSIKRISNGEGFEVYADKSLIASCGTQEMADRLVAMLDGSATVLRSVSLDCQMALSGEWDRGDDGFQATLDGVNAVLLTLGAEIPSPES